MLPLLLPTQILSKLANYTDLHFLSDPNCRELKASPAFPFASDNSTSGKGQYERQR